MNPGSTLSFVSPYLASRFDRTTEYLLEPFSISTLVGDSILAERVYKDYSVLIYYRDTMVDLVALDMVDFNVIPGIDWIYACYVIVDYTARTVKFKFPN